MSVPIPPPDPHDQTPPPLWRRLIAAVSLGVWPWGTFLLLFGPVAGEENLLGQGFTTLTEAPWWVLAGATMALVSTTLHFSPASAGLRRSLGTGNPASLRLAAAATIGGVLTRPCDSVGCRPSGDPRRRHSPLGLSDVQCRHRYS